MRVEHCPVCGNPNIQIKRYTLERQLPNPFPTLSSYEAYCSRCQTFEQHRDDEPAFATWLERWRVDA
jgi:hypothetical protein